MKAEHEIKWSISDVKTTEGETMIVGGEGQEFGLIATVTDEADARQIIADREARTGAPQGMQPDWQPISTAPKDGSKVLAFGLKDGRPIITVARWRRAEDQEGYVGWGEFNMTFWPPTHWMPLPTAPETTS